MKRIIIAYLYVFGSLFLFGQTDEMLPLIYPQLKTVGTKKINYKVLAKAKYVKDIDLKAYFLLKYKGCVEGNCEDGVGGYLFITEDKAKEPDEAVTKSLKERRSLYFDKKFKAQDRKKKFNKDKYLIPYEDKLQEHKKRVITYVLLKGTFSDNGEKFKGKAYEFKVNYLRDGYDFIPEVNVDFTKNNEQNAMYEGEMILRYNKEYTKYGIGKDLLLEKDPTIKKVTGLYGGYPRLMSMIYEEGQPIQSFTGIPSGNFFSSNNNKDIKLKGNYVFGHIKFSDGSSYIGGLLNDTYNGTGILKNPDGTVVQGLWVQGKLEKAQTINFPDVFFAEDLTQVPYKTISLEETYNPKDYFYFGDLSDGKPSGLGMYIATTQLQCYIGDIDKRIPGNNYFYYRSVENDFRSGVQLNTDTWYGLVYTSSARWDVAKEHFKIGEMRALPDDRSYAVMFWQDPDNADAEPNIGYGDSCIKILPNTEKEQMGYFQYPNGWYQDVDGKHAFLTNYNRTSEYIFYYGIDSKYNEFADESVLKLMTSNDTFCSPVFTIKKKQAIIKRQLDLAKAEKKYLKELEASIAKAEAAQKAFNDCLKPQIVMSGNPAQTHTVCNGHRTFGVSKSISQISSGDVIQYNGAMYQVSGKAFNGLKVLCDLEIKGSSFYVFEKLKNAGDALRNYCDCDGYKYVTRSSQVPTGRTSVVYENSVVTMVKQHTETRSYSFRVKTDCKSECGGATCWPSAYARGF